MPPAGSVDKLPFPGRFECPRCEGKILPGQDFLLVYRIKDYAMGGVLGQVQIEVRPTHIACAAEQLLAELADEDVRAQASETDVPGAAPDGGAS